MLEEKIKKIIVAGMLGGILSFSGCGEEMVNCPKPTGENYIGINNCAFSVYGAPHSIDACYQIDAVCICEKPKGESDIECECGCEDKPKPHEPVEKGW